MSVERLLQISIASMATLGTLILGMGQSSPVLPLMAVFAAVTSVLFTDIWGRFQLNRAVGNAAALLAAVYSLSSFFTYDPQQQLLSIAHLLVYLQIVLLYQQKSSRIYWELAVLSLLQVVVAAALDLGISFGVLLGPYILVSIASLVLFHLHREERQLVESAEVWRRRSYRLRSKTGWGRRQSSPHAGASHAGQSQTGVVAGGPGGQAPNRLQPAAESPLTAWGRNENTLPLTFPGHGPADLPGSPLDALVGWSLGRQMAAITVATMVFAAVFFYATPRQQGAAWYGLPKSGSAVMGFSSTISLTKISEIRENKAPVMRVWLTDAATGQVYKPLREPYFRGAALTRYGFHNGKASWSRPAKIHRSAGIRLGREANIPRQEEIVHQAIVVDNSVSGETLFGIYPLWRTPDTPDALLYHTAADQIFHANFDAGAFRAPFRYTVVTTGFERESQRTATPEHRGRFDPGYRWSRTGQQANPERMRNPIQRPPVSLELDAANPQHRFDGLKQMAEEVLTQANIDRQNRVQIAFALEQHLQNTQFFTYSLKLDEIPRKEDLDPIVDFALHHRTGHCEYFASALALMLRTVGIPSRVVVGFKGGDFNALGNYYQVRQSHAHAWVEAHLRPEDIPNTLIPPQEQSPNGAWLRLDPTPSAGETLAEFQEKDLLDRAGDLLNYAQFLWSDYVLGLNQEKQSRSIYDPRTNRATKSLSQAINDGWKKTVVRVAAVFGIDATGFVEGRWFHWQTSLATVALGLALVLLVRYGWTLMKRMFRRRATQDGENSRRRGRRVDFYERYENLLNQRGWRRQQHHTQREFAQWAEKKMRESDLHQVAHLPHRIAQWFYQVRFGETVLSADQKASMESSLANLEAAFVSSLEKGSSSQKNPKRRDDNKK